MKNKNLKEKKPFRLRFLTIVMLIVLLVTGGINGFCSYNIFWKGAAVGSAKNNGMTKEQIVLQKEREALEQREKEEQESGRISYTSLGQERNLELVIAGESDAYDVLLSVQDDLNLSNAQEEYAFSYSRSNEYYDVYTMQQYYDGIEVYGYDLKMTADKSGNLLSVDGTHAQLEEFDTTVSLSESDAYDYVEKYLKSEYQVTTDEVSIDGRGKKISFDENDEPVVGYLFEITDICFEYSIMNIIVDGNSGDVMCVLPNSLYADLAGQAGNQTLDISRTDTDPILNCLRDENRNITVYYRKRDDGTASPYYFDIDNSPEPAGVDALANIERIYDFYKDTFDRNGNDNKGSEYKIYLHSNWYDKQLGDEDYDHEEYISNNTQGNAQGGCNFLRFPMLNATMAQYLDVMAHEYTHGVLFSNGFSGESVSTAHTIHEAMADLFGELAEDYCDDEALNGTCNWQAGADTRNISDPKDADQNYLIDVRDYKLETEADAYYGSTILSHSAYLMTQGINGTEALNNVQLANLYYYMLSKMSSSIDFKSFRSLVETNAFYMNENTYGYGPYDSDNEAMQLSDAQFESVIDAFDRTGIERLYDYSLVPNAEITVTDMNDEAYDNYHLSIVKRNNGNVVVDEDIHSEEYELPNLEKGLYSFALTDLNDENLVESFDIIINDNADGQLSARYEETVVIPTKFGSPHKEVVLALDVSGSMDGTPISETKKAALNFVDTVFDANPNINVSLITYSSSASLVLESCNDESAVKSAVSGLRSGGDTYMCEALSIAQQILAEKDVDDKYLILMGDGLPSDSPDSIASSIREDNVILCSLGFFHKSADGVSLMKSLASSGYYYNVQDISIIQGLFEEIARQVSGERYSRSEIACPVDVTVTYQGETLSSAEETQNLRTSFGSITFEGEENEIKILRLDEKANYEICINGTGKGTMNYRISFADENGDYSDSRTFEDIPINKKTVISTNSQNTRNTLLQVDSDGDGKFDMKYIAGVNKESKKYEKVLLLRIAVIAGVVCILLLAAEIWCIVKRYRKNKHCPVCRIEIERNIKFCPSCGNAINSVPLLFPERVKRKPQYGGIKIIKFCTIGLCFVLIAGTLLIYRSAANTVFLQLRNQELVSAQLLYHNGIEDSWISKHYLSFVTSIYLDKVQEAYQENLLDENSAASVYSTVAEMDMGKASDSAKVYLTNIEQMKKTEEHNADEEIQ